MWQTFCHILASFYFNIFLRFINISKCIISPTQSICFCLKSKLHPFWTVSGPTTWGNAVPEGVQSEFNRTILAAEAKLSTYTWKAHLKVQLFRLTCVANAKTCDLIYLFISSNIWLFSLTYVTNANTCNVIYLFIWFLLTLQIRYKSKYIFMSFPMAS